MTAPIIMLTNLQLRGVQATDSHRIFRFGHYLALRLATTALALLVIAGIAFGSQPETGRVILAVGVSKAFESLSDVVYGLMQSHERMDHIALSMMIKGPLSLAALGTTVYLTGNVFWGVLTLAGCWGLILIAYDIPSGARLLNREDGSFRPRWDLPALVRLAWLALPLGIVMMLISLNSNIPGYFIEHYLGERELGIFAAFAYLMVAGITVMGALGQSASPRLARYYAERDGRAFCRLLVKLIGLGVGIGTAGILTALVAGREILTLLYKPEYADRVDIFAWLMVVAAVMYMYWPLGYGLLAARYFRAQVPLFGICGAASALGCLWLVPRFGLRGAAWAGLGASITQLVGSVVIIAHALRSRGD